MLYNPIKNLNVVLAVHVNAAEEMSEKTFSVGRGSLFCQSTQAASLPQLFLILCLENILAVAFTAAEERYEEGIHDVPWKLPKQLVYARSVFSKHRPYLGNLPRQIFHPGRFFDFFT